jgi:hypothetical protein
MSSSSFSSAGEWQIRWQSHEAFLKALQQEANPVSSLAALVEALSAFGKSQFTFFKEGFEKNKLLLSEAYPPACVLDMTLRQVGHDAWLLAAVVQQRQSKDAVWLKTLKTADSLAQLALNVATEGGYVEGKPETAVTYFHKAANIRLIPYAPAALVGVPISCHHLSNDFLAVPHEVGHYVFRHSAGLAAQCRQELAQEPAWLTPWLEEIFADVFGCIVAGPVIGLDFQDLLANDAQPEFVYDDGEHPVPAARPFLYSAVLSELEFTHAAAALDARWQRILQQRHTPQEFVPAGWKTAVPLTEVHQALKQAGCKLLNLLKPLVDNQKKNKGFWSNDIQPGKNVETLYDGFKTWLDTMPAVSLPTLKVDSSVLQVVLDGKVVNKRPLTATNSWVDTLKSVTSLSHPVPASVWEALLFVGGWNTSGPGGAWPPKG